MSLLGAAGAVVGGLQTVGGWLGIGQKKQDKRQISQQEKLNEVNAKTGKEMADYEQKLKYDMWDKTNLSAQMQQAAKAGVSKAAAIGGSGTGTQGASVGNVGGGQAADAAATQNAQTGQSAQGLQTAMQLGMMKAQIDNLNANTEKTKADAVKTSGVDTNLGNTQIESLKQGIENAKKQVEEMGAKIDNLRMDTGISGATKASQIKIAEEEAVTGVIRNMLMASQKDNVVAGTKKIYNDMNVDNTKLKQTAEQILQSWRSLDQGDAKNGIERFKAEIEANYKGIGNVVGRGMDDVISKLFEMMGKERGQQNSSDRYKK